MVLRRSVSLEIQSCEGRFTSRFSLSTGITIAKSRFRTVDPFLYLLIL